MNDNKHMLRETPDLILQIFTYMIVIIGFLWSILPMLALREEYAFTIHDGMDSYGGIVQNIFENRLYFHLNQSMPFMHGIEGKYTFISYNLYDFYCCIFGYVKGQILTRITGVFLAFFSLKTLLNLLCLYPNRFQKNMICLLSIAYAITPVAPNRMIAFAALPAIVHLFVFLNLRYRLTPYVLLCFFVPVFSIFDAVLIFVIIFWFISGTVIQFLRKQVNWNIVLSYVIIVFSTILVNWNFFLVAMSAKDTNRGLSFDETTRFVFDRNLLMEYLLNGQYHSTALQKRVLLPFLAVGTIYVLYTVYVKSLKHNKGKLQLVLICGWGYWFLSALVETMQECGLRTGILLIDGFQWGRAIGLMRMFWYIMFASVMFLTDRNKIWRFIMYCTICFQIVNVMTARTTYNDTFYSVIRFKQNVEQGSSQYCSYEEFFDRELFRRIKEDIHYDQEGVAAYGFHPSILINNCFETIDGYASVHSMQWQNEFREIIAPALDKYDEWKTYYDGWGGRMYLFGELNFFPTKVKTSEAYPLYVDTNAFVKYGGKYIISRAAISNSEELGIEFINDYDSEKSMYHLYVYKTTC